MWKPQTPGFPQFCMVAMTLQGLDRELIRIMVLSLSHPFLSSSILYSVAVLNAPDEQGCTGLSLSNMQC